MPPFDWSKVHGMLGDGQEAYSCLCGSGWLTVTSDEDAAREALRAHIAAAQE